MSSFKGRFNFGDLLREIQSDRNLLRRFVLSLVQERNIRYVTYGPIKIDILPELEKRLATISDDELSKILAAFVAEYCRSHASEVALMIRKE